MNKTNTHDGTRIEADQNVPTITIIRDFATIPENLYRAWTDPTLVAQWLGPDETEMVIEHWDARTGGSWRYRAVRDGETLASFYGSFHELRPPTRIVQTFTFEGAPDGVSLETMTFEDLGNGTVRATGLSVVESMELRDLILSSGMEKGVIQGYAKLDRLLAAQ